MLLILMKLRLFASLIKALRTTHRVDVYAIANWPVPLDQSVVRSFMGGIGIARRRIKNFAELTQPLSR